MAYHLLMTAPQQAAVPGRNQVLIPGTCNVPTQLSLNSKHDLIGVGHHHTTVTPPPGKIIQIIGEQQHDNTHHKIRFQT